MKKLILLLILIFSLPVAAQNFTIGKSTFLLNGKPFTVKAAELHYTRIPAPYWEHRIEMCKALGMNTICLYVFWNIHEQTEGQFDFTGQNDIAAFCRLASLVVTEEERYCTSYTRSLFYGAHCNLYERSRKTACTVADYSRRKHYHGAGRK